MKKPLIIAGRDDGFGERMRAFLNALYISKRFNLEFGFVWRDIIDANNVLDDKVMIPYANLPTKEFLFSKEFIEKYHKSNMTYVYTTPVFWSLYKKSINRLLEEPYEYDWGWYSTYDDLSLFFNDVKEDEYRQALSLCWKEIGFSDSVKKVFDQVEEIVKDLGDFIAVHVRAGDGIYLQSSRDAMYLYRYKMFPYGFAIDLSFKSLKKRKKVLLFSDDFNLANSLKKYCLDSIDGLNKENIFIMSDLVKDLSKYEQIVFEIVLMSKAKEIFASGTTGFARCASYIGQNSLINIYQYYSTKEQFEVISRYIEINDVHPLQKSFSYFHLYLLADELKISFEIKKEFLVKALENDPQNTNSKIFLINLLLKHQYYEEANEQLKIYLKNDEFLHVLLDNHFNPNLPSEIFLNYLKKDILNYPFIAKVALMIFYSFFNKESVINKHYQNLRTIILEHFYQVFYESKKLQPIGAVKIIHNHLSYKLGKAMIENSKSFLGYIRMPYVLSYIKEMHKQEKLSKDFPLEYYLDYEQACKEKNSFTYKLGEVLIKADKNWHKGGYIKLYFDIKNLKKSFSQKRRNG
ncbi:capsule biosynthesis protein CapA [Campylobacter novaezeelandiae]|nr:capsule biosynthesis protein CapA [Campylobacter novaezeelandiae]